MIISRDFGLELCLEHPICGSSGTDREATCETARGSSGGNLSPAHSGLQPEDWIEGYEKVCRKSLIYILAWCQRGWQDSKGSAFQLDSLTQTCASLGYQTPVRPPACLNSSLFRCLPKLSHHSQMHRSLVPVITQEVRIVGAMGGLKEI